MAVDTTTSPDAPVAGNGPAGLTERARAAGRAGWAWARRHAILAAAGLVAVVGGLTYLALAGGAPSGSGYVTAVVVRGDIEDSVTALGNLQPRDYVDVGAQVSGQLKKLYVEIGDRVKQGQLLAEIDPRVLNSRVETDKSNLANLAAQHADRQAQLALARSNFSRQKRLLAANATSRSDYDSALQALRSAEAQSKALQAQMAAARSQLDGDEVTRSYTKIYAPMDGTVVAVSAKQGQTLNANQQAPTILRVADLSTMTVWTQVSEADVPKLRVGMPAYFTTLGEPGRRWTGTLTQIQPTPEVVNNVVLYTATFDVKNPDRLLMTQMTAQVFFVAASAKNALVVPVAALHKPRHSRAVDGATAPNANAKPHRRRTRAAKPPLPAGAARYWVSVVSDNGQVARRPVIVGVSNRVSAEILSGLEAGEKVVVGENRRITANGADNGNRQRGLRRFGGLH